MIQLQAPDNNKLGRSALISVGGVLMGMTFLLAIKHLFPEFDGTELQVAIFTAVGGWVVNTIKESVK
jgi:hypothetical protein